MGIGVADQHVEDEGVDEGQDVEYRSRGPLPQKCDAILHGRSAFLLVFSFGRTSQRLAKVLLVQADRAIRSDVPVISGDDDAGRGADRPDCRLCRVQAHAPCERHAECLIGRQPRKALGLWFDDMGAGCVAQRQCDRLAINDDRELVLRTSQREADTFFAGHQWTARQLVNDGYQLLIIKDTRTALDVEGRGPFRKVGLPLDTPIYNSEWNRDSYNIGGKSNFVPGSTFVAASLIVMAEMHPANGPHALMMSHLFSARNQIWYENGTPKAPGIGLEAYGMMVTDTPNKLSITGGYTDNVNIDFRVISSKSNDGSKVNLLLTYYDTTLDPQPDNFTTTYSASQIKLTGL